MSSARDWRWLYWTDRTPLIGNVRFVVVTKKYFVARTQAPPVVVRLHASELLRPSTTTNTPSMPIMAGTIAAPRHDRGNGP